MGERKWLREGERKTKGTFSKAFYFTVLTGFKFRGCQLCQLRNFLLYFDWW